MGHAETGLQPGFQRSARMPSDFPGRDQRAFGSAFGDGDAARVVPWAAGAPGRGLSTRHGLRSADRGAAARPPPRGDPVRCRLAEPASVRPAAGRLRPGARALHQHHQPAAWRPAPARPARAALLRRRGDDRRMGGADRRHPAGGPARRPARLRTPLQSGASCRSSPRRCLHIPNSTGHHHDHGIPAGAGSGAFVRRTSPSRRIICSTSPPTSS